jgi:chemotaxis protein MotB
MARRRPRHEEHENHEAWAIPYGDLVTLLLAFFVVMYAMSSVNQGKYRVLSDSLTEAFHGTRHPPQPASAGEEPTSPIEMPISAAHRLIVSGLPPHPLTAPFSTRGTARAGQKIAGAIDPRMSDQHAVSAAPAPAAAPTSLPPDPKAGASSAQLGTIADEVSTAMGPLIHTGQVRVRRYQNWVAVDISTDILFGSGVAQLSGQAVPVLQHLADSLKAFPNAIRVEGHTDDRPINTPAFPSNWELSAARAASVVHLFMDRGVAADRLAVVGFGPYRPAASNLDPAGRNANRRVAVVILGTDSGPEGRL